MEYITRIFCLYIPSHGQELPPVNRAGYSAKILSCYPGGHDPGPYPRFQWAVGLFFLSARKVRLGWDF